MRRRDFITLLGSAVIGSPLSVRAQQPAKLARIGFLGAASASGQKHAVEALRAGLHDLGYVEGKHYIIEFRWARYGSCLQHCETGRERHGIDFPAP